MIILPSDASDEQILAAAEQWGGLLALEDYGAAFEATWHEAGTHCTPELIRQTIAVYGVPLPSPTGAVFRVTPLESANGSSREREVSRFDEPTDSPSGPPIIADVFFGGLPLNGGVSDLNATFWVRADVEGLKLELDEIHVH